MSRQELVNGEYVPLSPEREAERDAEEAAWAAEQRKPATPTLEQRLAVLEAVVLQGKTVQEAEAAAATVVDTGKLP